MKSRKKQESIKMKIHRIIPTNLIKPSLTVIIQSLNGIVLLVLLMIMSCTSFTESGQVSETKGEKYFCSINAAASNGITETDDDVFVIHYTDDTVSGTFEYTLITRVARFLTLPEGVYYINGIEYKGTNPEIEKQGYAVTSTFSIREDGASSIKLAVGSYAVKNLYAKNKDIICRKDDSIVSPGKILDENEKQSTETEIRTETGTEEISYENGTVGNIATEEKITATEEGTEPVTDTLKEPYTKTFAFRVTLFSVIAIILVLFLGRIRKDSE